MKHKTVPTAILLIVLASQLLVLNPASADGNAVGASIIWERTFGGASDDRAFYATATEDGVLVAGSTASIVAGQTVAWVLRLDSDGNLLWNKTYLQGAGSEFRYIINLPDGFLLVGNTFSAGGNPNGYAVKIDNQGNPQWNITLGEGTVNRLFGAAKAQDGFVLAGLTQTGQNADDTDVWLIKIDGSGRVLWNKTFGWSNEDAARSVASVDGENFFVAGYTNSLGYGDFDFLVLKVDASGNLLWNQTYGGAESDKAYTITPANDGFAVAGDTRSEGAGDSDALVIKINQDGQQQWKKTFGGDNFDSPSYIQALTDGSGFVVCGTTFSFGKGQRDFWLFTIDNQGNLQQTCTVGTDGYEEAYAVVQVSSGTFVLAGWKSSDLQGAPYDFYVVKVQVENRVEWWQTNMGVAAILGAIVVVVVGLLLLRLRLIKKGN